jgi:hypothetical protein
VSWANFIDDEEVLLCDIDEFSGKIPYTFSISWRVGFSLLGRPIFNSEISSAI